MSQSFSVFNSKTKVVNTLDTYQHTVTTAGMHTVEATVNDQIPPMGLIITIAQNGTTAATSATPAGSQIHTNLCKVINAAVGDVLSIQLSSSVVNDTLPNGFQAILKITEGQV